MTTWQEPTGRERAIEALMDRDKDGDYFRVRKVMEEAVPAALNSRPNKVTKAALVDQAFCLQGHVIDSAISHGLVFGSDIPSKLPKDQPLVFEMKNRVWKHQSYIQQAKRSGDALAAPPPAFYRTLESVLKPPGENSTGKSLLEDIKKFTTEHSLMELCDNESVEETSRSVMKISESADISAVAACERMVANMTKLIDADERYKISSGIWITILSILTLDQQNDEKIHERGIKEASKASSVSSVGKEAASPLLMQIGALLPFFEVHPGNAEVGESKGDTDVNEFDLNPELLTYFAKAAAVHVERLEAMEARKKQKQTLETLTAKPDDDNLESTTATADNVSTGAIQTQQAEAVQGRESEVVNSAEQSEVETGGETGNWESQRDSGSDDDDEDNNEEVAPVNESPAEEADPQSSDGSESSSSGDSSSSSSSSSDEHNEDAQPEIPEAAAFVESERDISTDDDDDAILREALGINVSRDEAEAEAVRVILADNVVPMEDESMAMHRQVETPVSEDASTGAANVVSEEDTDPLDESAREDAEDEVPLPQLPAPPVAYPWKQPGPAATQASDPDAISSGMSPPLDPSDLSHFAAVPSSCALLHLLKYAEAIMQREETGASLAEPPIITVPGGMGHELFSMRRDSREEPGQLTTLQERPFVFQLLVSTLLSIAEKRADAIEHLNQAFSREKIAIRGGDTDLQGFIASTDSSASGEEQDDPALTFALNYVEDDASLSVESLENKGMKRKAAAAAHDAETLRKTLRKRTAEWKSRALLYSRSLLTCLRCLTSLLQLTTRHWLSVGGSKQQSSLASPVLGFKQFIPAEGLSRLSAVLDALMGNIGTGKGDSDCGFLVPEIYAASLAAWSECFPLLYSSVNEKFGLLYDLLEGVHGGSLELSKDSSGVPVSKAHGDLLKLRSLSKRIRVTDILESLIPSPVPFMLEGSDGATGMTSTQESPRLQNVSSNAESSHFSSLANSLILKYCDSELTRTDSELRQCLYSLCHRMNAVAIMFDGFYAATETETEKTSAMTQKSKDGLGNGLVLDKTPSNNFVFDVTKCADSIAILTGFDSAGGNGSTVLQRASKVWGTVHSSQFYSPKTGIHRWAVRLDKCERGHVFVGVATSRANVRTYVGGDKHGWGMIGTQALWHDRRKIRGDYGAPFRTGSTVIVTLDTNLGTISLGLWKDTATGSQDPSVQNLLSPKRNGRGGGTIEDWGIAFEGLPLDAKMYPAVGLYQRDDRVTLLSVDSDVNGKSGSVELVGGKSFYPPLDRHIPRPLKEKAEQTRIHNSLVNWDGTEYAAKILERTSEILDIGRENANHLLPSVLSSICLLPSSVPVLSQRTALALLPHISRCLKSITSRKSSVAYQAGRRSLVEGEWIIRATSGDGDLEEYIVTFVSALDDDDDCCGGFEGTGVGTTGKSKNGLVTISGAVNGLSVSFLEEWSDEGNKGSTTRDDSSSCVVHGAISLDGTRLEGRYRNMEFGTTGKVAGIKKGSTESSDGTLSDKSICNAELLLCLAHSHLAAIVSDDAAKDGSSILTFGDTSSSEDGLGSQKSKLSPLLKKPFLANSSLRGSCEWLASHVKDLMSLYSPPLPSCLLCGIENGHTLENTIKLVANEIGGMVCEREKLDTLVNQADESVMNSLGRRGSLAAINPRVYDESRKGVICALLFHCSLTERLAGKIHDAAGLATDQSIRLVWQTGLLIMEDGIRQAMSQPGKRILDSFKHHCDLISATTTFLLDLEIDSHSNFDRSTAEDIRSCYQAIKDENGIIFFKQKMRHATSSSAFQLAALESTKDVLSIPLSSVGLECVALGLCKIMAQLPGGLAASRRAGLKNATRRLPGGPGADLSVRSIILKYLVDVFLLFLEKCGQAVRNRGQGASRRQSDSLVLACLCVFMLCLDGPGFKTIVSFLSKMKDVLSAYRSALQLIDVGENYVNVVKAMSERDVAYAILRCASAAIHVCFYRLSNDPSDLDDSMSIEYPVNWFRLELERSLAYLEDVFGRQASKRVESCALEEWERWLCQADPKNADKAKTHSVEKLKNTSHCLIEVGTIQHLDFNSGPKSSASFRQEGRKYSGGPEHRHLSHWLHMLCAVIRKKSPFRDSLLNDTALTSVLLKVLGLDHVRSTSTGAIGKVEIRRRDRGLLPARYRARIAFFLGLVIPAMDPNAEIAEGLFCLAGSDLVATGADEEEYLVSREAVSLLRKLYNPELRQWRQCLDCVVSSFITCNSLVKRLGLHSFLSGLMTSVTRLSFVLLKPVVAVPYNQEGGGKMSPGANHTMVPVGADSVVSGLLRSSAEGGIVSNIDDKNGICEVILINRSDDDVDYFEDVVPASNKRPGLTVRALRTPVADVILAQEIPLHFDGQSIPPHLVCAMLEQTLDSLLTGVAPDSIALSFKDIGIEIACEESMITSQQMARECHDRPAQTSERKQQALNAEDAPLQTVGANSCAQTAEKEKSPISANDVSLPLAAGGDNEYQTADNEQRSNNGVVTLETTQKQSCPVPRPSQESSLDDVGSGVYGLSLDVMTLRSAIVILSNEDMVASVMGDKRCRSILLKILYMAWPEEQELSKGKDHILGARHSDMSSLPLHETKMCHLTLMLRNLAFRELVVLKTPEDLWTTRAAEYANLLQERPEADLPVPASAANETAVSSGTNPDTQTNGTVSQSTGGSHSDDEEDEQDEASALAAQHLREAAIAQMGELGIPRSYAELALRRIGGTNIEAAVHFCLENGSEIERLLAEEMQRQAAGQGGRARPREDSHLLQQLMEMGFPRRWCTEALAATGNNVDEALTWILNNNETLESLDASDEEEEEEEEDDASADGGGEEEEEESDDDTDDGDGNQEANNTNEEMDGASTVLDQEPGWTAQVTPLKVVSGRATIDSSTLEVSGQSNGGFASVGVKGVLLKSGKWYYEVVLGTAGCIQLGFGDASFAGHCNADRGDGCGDSSSSFSFDGWRRLRWHLTATEWGCRWKEGDVVGCLVDIDKRIMSFTLNGKGESIGMGVAFSGFSFCGGLYPVVSFNRKERLRLILGGSGASFRFNPPAGYRGVGEALIESVKERDALVQKESILCGDLAQGHKYLPDFSDEEHGNELFSWSHRYYGSDASVHLGSSRSKISSKSGDSSPATSPTDQVTRRVDAAWCKAEKSVCETGEQLSATLRKGYEAVHSEIAYEFFNEAVSSVVILCRKLLFHAVISSRQFDVAKFARPRENASIDVARLWKVIETACSVRNWSGEAGAMAMAAEALGLGIQVQSRHPFERLGISSQELVSAHRPGFTQLLTSLTKSFKNPSETSNLFAAAAEWNGNPSIFLRQGVESAITSSDDFRQVVLAFTRRSVRFLAGIEETETRTSTSVDEEAEPSAGSHEDALHQPDARFVSFVTGVLMNARIDEPVAAHDLDVGLFQAWSVGLLSASLPWRMVSALTACAILERNPSVFVEALTPTLARYYGRLHGTVARRAWAERAAYPICSRYFQAILELLFSVRRSFEKASGLPDDFLRYWKSYEVEASAPRCLPLEQDSGVDLQLEEGWIANEEVWIGCLTYSELLWTKPGRSSVRPMADGEGPPMLREGCMVMRGPDWERSDSQNEDGYDAYETAKKKRDQEVKSSKKASASDEKPNEKDQGDGAEVPLEAREQKEDDEVDGTAKNAEASKREDISVKSASAPDESSSDSRSNKKRKKKVPHPKLPLGTVISIEPWKGVPAVGRRVRWLLTGNEGVYRFGGDGGKHDVVHVETNSRGTRVTKRYPFPETAEQCAARRGFGSKKSYSVLLRFKRPLDSEVQMTSGILELPDFGAAVKVMVRLNADGSVVVREEDMLFGSKDSGWEARFGQPSFVAGSEYVLRLQARRPNHDLMSPFASFSEKLEGSSTFKTLHLRNPLNGEGLSVTSTLKLRRGRRMIKGRTRQCSSFPPPLVFDKNAHAPNLTVSKDGLSVTCVSADGRGCAFAEVGFSKGFHFWEVKIESCESGSIFIGCAEKPPAEGPSRFNRWLGWGFVNFRATYTSGSEKVYGVHAHSGDTIGVLLDCDAGRVAFFYDGLKYGEHILNDLGCAFENLSPFGFSVEGCGTGGQGQGATSGFPRSPAQGFVRPKTLFPVVGLRNHGDRVTLRPGWTTTYGVDGPRTVENVLRVLDAMDSYKNRRGSFPDIILEEAFREHKKWLSESTVQKISRGSRVYKIELDTSAYGCAAASSALGLKTVLLPGDRLRLKRSAGRVLELAEEAIVLGQHQLRLYYKIVSQKNEGQSLNEGGELPHFFEECDMVDGVEFVTTPKGSRPALPLLDRFTWRLPFGLKVVYSGGAVIRSDIEINDASKNLGTVPTESVIAKEDIIERRVNSCGVVRFRVRHGELEGYISANIRGGTEEQIVQIDGEEADADSHSSKSYCTPYECADDWLKEAWDSGLLFDKPLNKDWEVSDERKFKDLLSRSCPDGVDPFVFDETLVSALSALGDLTPSADALDCKFSSVVSAFSGTFDAPEGVTMPSEANNSGSEVVAMAMAKLDSISKQLPPLDAVLARLSVLRVFNMRARFALPWIPLRPAQEGSALFGGLHGLGPPIDKAGRATAVSRRQRWWQSPSLPATLRSCRGLFFTSVKRGLLSCITEVTTTPTPLSHDEYELPREIRTVRINRMRAARAMDSTDAILRRKYSVFSQLQNETKSWGGAALRRGYVAKGHGGQKRAFKVKFVGEGVNDYSGPYREVFAEAMNEVLKVDTDGNGILAVLDASPNTASGIGENQGLYIFSANGQSLPELRPRLPVDGVDVRELHMRDIFSSLLSARNEASREVEESLLFLGRLTGTAFRHGILFDLPLPQSTFWKMIVEDDNHSPSSQLSEIDILASKSNPSTPLLWWQKRMLNFYVEGLSNVIPAEVLPIFSARELQDTFCGRPDVDVDILKQVVEYEGYEGEEAVVKYFWDVLRESTAYDRKAFLQYVWARSRLPSRVADFETPFKIIKDTANSGERADIALPSASTCFFSLTLPEYSSAEILRQKLLFAIHNVTTMETDFQTNTAEVAEGYRALAGGP
ncbi:hypothetical protein ACA910_011302 [Epithemia clementina (nom. ined.)]